MTVLEREGLSDEQKQQLLDEVIRGNALGRSEQLRQMLRYLVTAEIEGRASLLSEHSVGVAALGRSPDYSPDVDSTVRTRAHELRKRLDDFYRGAPAGSWRLELPKGTYQPRFVRIAALAPEPPAPPATARPRQVLMFAAGFLAAAACGSALWWASQGGWARGQAEQASAEIWGAVLKRDARVTVALAAPLQFWIREFDPASPPRNDPPFIVPLPESPQVLDWIQKQRPEAAGRRFLLHPNNHSPLWGEAAGAIAIAEFLGSRAVHVELIGERNIRPAALKERNAIVIGRAEYNRSAQALHPSGGWTVRYVPSLREIAIVDREGSPLFRKQPGGLRNYGLATFLSRPTSQGMRRTVLFAGINSDATQAAMDYMTSPHRLVELAREFRKNGGTVPDSFQVVVQTTSNDSQTIAAERVGINILDPR
jgi:hypothetical protein